jgi:ABC-2 type transport system permease protein
MTMASLPIRASPATPGLLSQVSAEWTKLRSARALYVQVVLAILLGIGFSALICLAVASSWDKMTVSQQADFDPLVTGFAGTAFSTIVLAVTGVTLVSSEYTSGMIRLTMTVTPSRLRVLFAKLIVVAIVTWSVGLVVVIGSFFAGQAVLGTHSGIPTVGLGESAAQRGVLAAWLTTPLFPLIGSALGSILRSTASAITSTLVLYFVPSILSGLLPEWWRRHLIAYLPANASDALLRSDTNYLGYISPAVATLAILAWLALFFAVASMLLERRDV